MMFHHAKTSRISKLSESHRTPTTTTNTATASTAYTYDTLGRLTETTRTLEGNAYTTRLHYDTLSRVIKTDYPGGQGFYTENIYDAQGFLKRVRGSRSTAETHDLAQLTPLIQQATDLATQLEQRAQTLRAIGQRYRTTLSLYRTLLGQPPVDDPNLQTDLQAQKTLLDTLIEQGQTLDPEFLGHLNHAVIELENVTALIDHTLDDYQPLIDQLTVLAEQTLAAADHNYHHTRTLQAGGNVYQDDLTDPDPNHITYWQVLDSDASGRISAEVYGNGVVNDYRYNAATGQLQVIHSGLLASAPLRHIEYQYDTWNNVTVRDDLVNGIREQFDYDRLDRLTATTLTSNRHLGNIEISQSQSYDVYGNIVSKSDVGSYQYDATRPHAVSQAGGQDYSYDANGNLLNGNQRSFTWNSNNKPTRIEQSEQWVTFDYGPNRSRYKKTNHQGDTTWYVGQLYEKTVTSDDTQHQHHIYAGSNLVAIHSVSEDNDDGTKVNNTRYLHKDALGSIDTITDSDANVIERRSVDAWGKQRDFDWQNDGSYNPNYRAQLLYTTKAYTGHESIAEVDLIHMNGRVYDAVLARFISADPYIQSASLSQSYNRYSYVMNNPMKYTDPSGYFFKRLFKSIRKAFKKAVRSVIRALGPEVSNLLAVVGSAFFCGPAAAACYAAAQYEIARAYGASPSSAAFTAIQAGIMYHLGEKASNWLGVKYGPRTPGNVIGNGLVGGTFSVVQGGKFGHGFISSGFSAWAKPLNFGYWPKGADFKIHRTVTAAFIGGTAAELGGGKFANGAATAAFTHWHNGESEKFAQKRNRIIKEGSIHTKRTRVVPHNTTGDWQTILAIGDIPATLMQIYPNQGVRVLGYGLDAADVLSVQSRPVATGQSRIIETYSHDTLYDATDPNPNNWTEIPGVRSEGVLINTETQVIWESINTDYRACISHGSGCTQ